MITSRGDITMFAQDGEGNDFEMHQVRDFNMYVSLAMGATPSGHINIENYADEELEIIDIDDGHNINYAENHGDFTNVIQNFVVVFNKEFYLDYNNSLIFNAIFTQEGNRYVQNYKGYYHYNNGEWANSSYTFYYTAPLFLTNSAMYNTYNHGGNTDINFALMKDGTTPQGSEFYVLKNGTYAKTTNINISGLLPQYVRQCMQNEGVFQFVDDTQDTTWYEMILATMDAPLYYIRNLLGFELFGINLFIAFSSLMTLMLIIAIIKKVV